MSPGRPGGSGPAGTSSTEGPADTAIIVVHPASNFLGHYMLASLANCGVDAIGLCTRYVGNDSSLADGELRARYRGRACRHLRGDGYQKIVLVGNSGGGGLAALYESQAGVPDDRGDPAGDPPDLTKADLPPADGLVFLMAHPGRSIVFTEWFDPAITDEQRPLERLPLSTCSWPRTALPLMRCSSTRYRAAQVARNRRITAWVHEQLAILASRGAGRSTGPPFAVHGTVADPRMVDLSIDPSDREATTPWGPASVATYIPVSLGHQASLRSWLSQWSFDESNGDGRVHAARVDVRSS